MTPEQAAALFNSERLVIARLSTGLLKKELADRVGKTPAAISQYEHGYAKPSPETLASLSAALDYPVSFFATTGADPMRPSASSTHFRSLRSSSQRERDQALARAALLSMVSDWIEYRVRLPKADIPVIPVPVEAGSNEIEEVAATVRREWGLDPGPVPNVVRLLERQGVIVGRLPLNSARVDAFSYEVGRPVVILGADKDDKARSRMDAAHELGHLVMHHDAEPGDGLAEQQANAFAAAFLMPAHDIRDELPGRVDFAELVDLKSIWGVSLQALLFRARRLGTLSESAYRRAMTKVSANGWRKKEPGYLGPVERPELLWRAVELLSEETGASLTQMSEELRLAPEKIRELIDHTTQRLEISFDDAER